MAFHLFEMLSPMFCKMGMRRSFIASHLSPTAILIASTVSETRSFALSHFSLTVSVTAVTTEETPLLMSFHFWLTTSFVFSTALDTAFLAASHFSLTLFEMLVRTGASVSLIPVQALLITPPISVRVLLMPSEILFHAPCTISLQFSQMKEKGRVIICKAPDIMLAMSLTANSTALHMVSQAAEHMPATLSHRSARKFLMPVKTSETRTAIAPKMSEKYFLMPSHTDLILFHTASHKSPNHSQIAPQFSKIRISPAIAATTPATMAITGPHAARKAPIAGIAVAVIKPMNVPNALVIAPIAITSWPTMIRTGARPATNAPTARIVLRVPSSIC